MTNWSVAETGDFNSDGKSDMTFCCWTISATWACLVHEQRRGLVDDHLRQCGARLEGPIDGEFVRSRGDLEPLKNAA
jgi:hypothetical protein